VILFLVLLSNTPLLPSLRADQLSANKPSAESSILQSVTCHTGYLELGLLYFKTKQYDQAINTFEKILVLEPNNFDAHYYLGNIYLEKGDFNRAKSTFEKADLIIPNNEKLHQVLDELDKLLVSNIESRLNNLSNFTQQQSLTQVQTPIPSQSHISTSTAFLPSTITQTTSQRFDINITKYLMLIFGISTAIGCLFVFSPILIRYLTIRSVASKDYKLSRGTQHLKQIKFSLKGM
jgi:tetratricopeptide (TPR) repeat protein